MMQAHSKRQINLSLQDRDIITYYVLPATDDGEPCYIVRREDGILIVLAGRFGQCDGYTGYPWCNH